MFGTVRFRFCAVGSRATGTDVKLLLLQISRKEPFAIGFMSFITRLKVIHFSEVYLRAAEACGVAPEKLTGPAPC